MYQLYKDYGIKVVCICVNQISKGVVEAGVQSLQLHTQYFADQWYKNIDLHIFFAIYNLHTQIWVASSAPFTYIQTFHDSANLPIYCKVDFSNQICTIMDYGQWHPMKA